MDTVNLKKNIFSNKILRQDLEIDMFLKIYNIKHNSDFRVFQKRDKPDYFIKGSIRGILGVEVSAAYMNDSVVGIEHKKSSDVDIPYDQNYHQQIRDAYFTRILDRVNNKVDKVRAGEYDTTYPIILALYLNDYYIIHILDSEWSNFEDCNKEYFQNIKEFEEIFLFTNSGCRNKRDGSIFDK